jgi:SAM-dependent methyltransferase
MLKGQALKQILNFLVSVVVICLSWLPKSSLSNLRKVNRYIAKVFEAQLSVRINAKSRFPSDMRSLNLGGGEHKIPGYVTLDFSQFDFPGVWNYDVTYGLALETDSLERIYSSHTFEHFLPEHILFVMSECYRVLKPGGSIRLVLPNIPEILRAYARDPSDALEIIRSHPSIENMLSVMPRISNDVVLPIDCVNYAVYDIGPPGGHKCIFDEATLHWCLETVGFYRIEFDGFNNEVDYEPHRHFSIYCSALKPEKAPTN